MCVGHGWAPLIPPRFSGLSSLRQTPAHRRSCACFTAQTVAFGASSGCAFLAGSWPLLGQILASPWPARLVLRERIRLISRTNRRGRAWTRGTIFGGNGTMSFFVDRRGLFRASIGLAAARLAAGALAAPALIGRAEAAVLKLKLSSS